MARHTFKELDNIKSSVTKIVRDLNYSFKSVDDSIQNLDSIIYSSGGNTIINSTGDININSTGGYVNIDAKNIYLVNTVYDDIRVPVTSVKAAGTKDPGFQKILDNGAGSVGVYTYHFDKDIQEELFFTLQIPHSYKSGTNLLPHVHWMPTSTGGGNVVWGLEYSLNHFNNGTFPNTSIVTGTGAAGVVSKTHLLTNLSTGIIGTTGVSSMLLGRVFRDSTNLADTYGADAALLEIDFHYQIDKLGTDLEYSS